MTDDEMHALLYESEESLNDYDREIKAYIEGLTGRISELMQTLDDIHSNTVDYEMMTLTELHFHMDRIEELARATGI